MPEHPLQAHVLRLARRLHLSRGVILQRAVRVPGHRDGRVDALADVDDVADAHPARREPAVGHEPRGHWRYAKARRTPSPTAMRSSIKGETSGHCLRRGPRRQQQQRRDHRQRDQELLRVLRADPGHEQKARGKRADDGAERVGGVHAAREPAGSCPFAAAAASASGKLAPHRAAAGNSARNARARSS